MAVIPLDKFASRTFLVFFLLCTLIGSSGCFSRRSGAHFLLTDEHGDALSGAKVVFMPGNYLVPPFGVGAEAETDANGKGVAVISERVHYNVEIIYGDVHFFSWNGGGFWISHPADNDCARASWNLSGYKDVRTIRWNQPADQTARFSIWCDEKKQ